MKKAEKGGIQKHFVKLGFHMQFKKNFFRKLHMIARKYI